MVLRRSSGNLGVRKQTALGRKMPPGYPPGPSEGAVIVEYNIRTDIHTLFIAVQNILLFPVSDSSTALVRPSD